MKGNCSNRFCTTAINWNNVDGKKSGHFHLFVVLIGKQKNYFSTKIVKKNDNNRQS